MGAGAWVVTTVALDLGAAEADAVTLALAVVLLLAILVAIEVATLELVPPATLNKARAPQARAGTITTISSKGSQLRQAGSGRRCTPAGRTLSLGSSNSSAGYSYSTLTGYRFKASFEHNTHWSQLGLWHECEAVEPAC